MMEQIKFRNCPNKPCLTVRTLNPTSSVLYFQAFDTSMSHFDAQLGFQRALGSGMHHTRTSHLPEHWTAFPKRAPRQHTHAASMKGSVRIDLDTSAVKEGQVQVPKWSFDVRPVRECLELRTKSSLRMGILFHSIAFDSLVHSTHIDHGCVGIGVGRVASSTDRVTTLPS